MKGTLNKFDIREANEALCAVKKISHLLGLMFANDGGGSLSVYQGNKFEALDLSIFLTDELQILEDRWTEIEREVAGWTMSLAEL